MKRLKEEFLNRTEETVPLKGMNILEVGCGSGSRSVAIAERCSSVVAIEPSLESIALAIERNSRNNIQYQVGSAESLSFNNEEFDTVIFTLSFHHIPFSKMHDALAEAVRVTKKGGHIIFLEPAQEGSYFESEILFDAGDGDERNEKFEAYRTISNFDGYTKVAEIDDETIFQFDSVEDFVNTFNPKQNLEQLENFLLSRNLVLNAKRRICVYRV